MLIKHTYLITIGDIIKFEISEIFEILKIFESTTQFKVWRSSDNRNQYNFAFLSKVNCKYIFLTICQQKDTLKPGPRAASVLPIEL